MGIDIDTVKIVIEDQYNKSVGSAELQRIGVIRDFVLSQQQDIERLKGEVTTLVDKIDKQNTKLWENSLLITDQKNIIDALSGIIK